MCLVFTCMTNEHVVVHFANSTVVLIEQCWPLRGSYTRRAGGETNEAENISVHVRPSFLASARQSWETDHRKRTEDRSAIDGIINLRKLQVESCAFVLET